MLNSSNQSFNRQFIYTCPENVLFDESISLSELRLYMIIRSFMDTTGSAYPSNDWLASKLNINKRNTKAYIKSLIEKNYLERVVIDGRRYLKIKVTPIDEFIATEGGVAEGHGGVSLGDTEGVSLGDPQLDQNNIYTKVNNKYKAKKSESSKFVQNPDGKPSDILTQASCQDSSPVKPSVYQETYYPQQEIFPSVHYGFEHNESFEEFWNLYPVKKGKKSCQLLWNGNQLHKIKSEIMEKLQNQIENDVQWKDGFIPSPRNYLEGELWNDEIKIKSKKVSTNTKSIHADYDPKDISWIFKKRGMFA